MGRVVTWMIPWPAVFAAAGIAAAQDTQPPLPWFAVLGLRAADVNFRMKVADRVVLVPDQATFLDEISRWSLGARWPVLIEDDWFAPRFIRAFKPQEVVRRTSVGSPMPAGDALRGAVDRAVTASWSRPGVAQPTSPRAAFESVRFTPAGLVAMREGDPQVCAGAALAAWHGEPVAWVNGDYGSLGSTMTQEQMQALSDAVEGAAKACGYPSLALGDSIETVTVALTTGLKATLPSTPQFTQIGGSHATDPAATVDALCRTESGSRWGVAASIVGAAEQSVAMAMASAFLSPSDALLWNGYPDSGQWQLYGFSQAAPMLESAGIGATVRVGAEADARDFRGAGAAGLNAPLVLLNSKGNWNFFDLADETQADALDVPPLVVPAAISMIHSFSLQMPAYAPSIGARWLDHGVYAYVGSVQEPMLNGFVPPALQLERATKYVPFLVASRWLEGPGDACWRIALIGDPLMQLRPASAGPAAPRLSPEQVPADLRSGCAPLRSAAIDLLTKAKAGSADPAVLGAAARDIALLGDLTLACGTFFVAEALTPEAAAAAAPFALESLFLSGEHEGFMRAFALIKAPSPRQLDLLWAMWTPFIGPTMDRAVVRTLAENPRQPRAAVDLGRLAPQMSRALGPDGARAALTAAIAACPDEGNRDAIRQLLGGV